MMKAWHSPTLGYLLAVAGVAIATLARLALAPLVDTQAPYLAFILATMVTAWHSGFGPTLVSALLGGVAAKLFFIHPYGSLLPTSREEIRIMVGYYIVGITMSVFSGVMRRARRRNEENLEALNENRRWLSTALKSIGDGVITTERDGRINFLNPVAETLTGWSLKEAAGKHLDEVFVLINEHTGARIEDPVARVLNEGSLAGIEYRTVIKRRDGTQVPVSHSGAQLVDEQENVAGVVLVLHDMSERRRTEEALRRSKEQFDLALAAGKMGIWQWDIQKGKISWSDSLEPLHGLAPGTFGGTFDAFINLVHPEDRGLLNEAIIRSLEAGEDYNTEFRIIWPDGSIHWIEGKGKAFLDRANNPVQLIGLGLDITERKRAEEAAAFLASIVESSEDAIIGKTPEGIIVSWNSGAEKIYGYKADEVKGRSISVIIPPELQGEEDDIMRCVNSGERVQFLETVRVTKEGKRIDVALTISPIKDAGGKILGASTIGRDITERKRAEQAFKVQALVLSSMAEGVSLSDENGFILYTNPAEDAMFGYEPGELIGEHVSIQNIYPPEENKRKVAEVIDHLKTEGAWRGEFQNRRKDGTEFITETQITALETGGIKYWVAVQEDITERKKAEATLKESEERFRQLADAMPQIVWTSRPDGYLDYYNKRWYEYTGMPEGIGGDSSWESVLHPDDLQHCKETWYHSVETGEVYQIEYRFKDHKTGAYRWHLGRALPIRDESGNIIRWFGTSTDIDDQKRTQDALKQVNQAKDQFLATVSHELRTPLNAILGWSTMLRGGRLDTEDAVRAAEVIERNAKAQAQLIEDILDASRIISGKLRLDIGPTNLVSVINAAADSLRPAADAKAIDLRLAIDSSIGPVSGDPDRLQQVVWNLLSNAIKFTPENGTVTVRLARADSYAEIEVEDTGQGISPGFLPFVFERFLQEDGTLTRRYGGLGLGLAIVRHLVEMHGGSIRALSEGEGMGACFTVRLPLRVSRALVPPLEAPRASEPERARADFAASQDLRLVGLKLLVVDDEADTLELLIHMLKGEGAEVEAADSAQKAIELLDRFKPTVLLSDIAMPGEDGYSLIARMKAVADSRGWRIHAVALTAHVRVEDRARALAAGFEMFVPKPVIANELIEAISLLAGRSMVKGG